MATPLLQTHDLVRRYGNKTALDGVSLELNRNETVGLVGKNGAGKTTLLSVMAGLMPPTAGTLEHPAANTGVGPIRIGFQPQENCFKPGIPVLRQLTHLARLQGLHEAAAASELERLTRELELQDYVNRSMDVLSHGMRKRVNILQAFMGTPELILLDEPTAGLDPAAAATVRTMIRSRSNHTTFLISSHNLYELQDICRRVILLDRGRITDNIDLIERSAHNRILRLTLDRGAEETLLKSLAALPGVSHIKKDDYDHHKLVLQAGGDDLDRLQLAVQNHIHDQGYSLLQLSRGKNLSDEVTGKD